MTSRLTKTIKVTDETHKAIRVAAANGGITMAEWLANVVICRTHPIMLADITAQLENHKNTLSFAVDAISQAVSNRISPSVPPTESLDELIKRLSEKE